MQETCVRLACRQELGQKGAGELANDGIGHYKWIFGFKR